MKGSRRVQIKALIAKKKSQSRSARLRMTLVQSVLGFLSQSQKKLKPHWTKVRKQGKFYATLFT